MWLKFLLLVPPSTIAGKVSSACMLKFCGVLCSLLLSILRLYDHFLKLSYSSYEVCSFYENSVIFFDLWNVLSPFSCS